MQKWNLVFDLTRCTGCHNCTLSVQDEYVGNAFPGYAAPMPLRGARWVELRRRDRGAFPAVDVAFLFQACQHCDDPPCMRVARDGAVRKREDGIVIIDPEQARGQKQIVDACPYGAVHWNEELQLPQHWNFDAHLIDAGWRAPRPVQACPTAALRALKVTDEEMRNIAVVEGLVTLQADRGHGARLYYRHLSRFTHEFVAGTLVGVEGPHEVCVAGARATLLHNGARVGEATSDAFGDFRFDALPPGSGAYSLDITADGYRRRTIDFELAKSCWLGEVSLEPLHAESDRSPAHPL